MNLLIAKDNPSGSISIILAIFAPFIGQSNSLQAIEGLFFSKK